MTHPHARQFALSARNRLAAAPLLVFALLFVFSASGCGTWTLSEGSGGGQLSIASQSSPGTKLAGGFSRGWCSYNGKDSLTILLIDGPEDDPSQVVTVRMFWEPSPGKTPIDPTATNATIHYVIFTGQDKNQVGIYSGAGFVFPTSDPGDGTLEAGVWQANLTMADRSAGFNDLLGQAMLRGDFTAANDSVAVEQALRRINVKIQQRLGYPRQVLNDALPQQQQQQRIASR